MKPILLIFVLASFAKAQVGDNGHQQYLQMEPSTDRPHALLDAITAFEDHHIELYKSKYDSKNSTMIFMESANYLGRVKTTKGYRQVCTFLFIRGTNRSLQRGGIPRGHPCVAIFDDSMHLVSWHAMDGWAEDRVRIFKGKVEVRDEWSYDLSTDEFRPFAPNDWN